MNEGVFKFCASLSKAVGRKQDGWTVAVEPQLQAVTTDSQGTIDYTLTDVNVTAKCTPLGLTESQILAALSALQGRGSSIAGLSDLTIASTNGLTEATDDTDAALEQTGGQGLTALPGAAGEGGTRSVASAPLFNERKTPVKPTQNASGQEDVLAAFSKDNGPAAEAVKKLLENPTPESALALAYLSGSFLAEASEGALKFDSNTVFEHAAVTSRQVAIVGCAVAISYTIEG